MSASPQPKIDCVIELAAIDTRLTRVKLNPSVAAQFTVLRRKALAEIEKGETVACRATIAAIHRLLTK